jgi:DNA polymerase elongation subunit (family B)
MKIIPNEKICINCWEYLNLPNAQKEVVPVIFAWYRDYQKNRKRLVFRGFEPYCYVDQSIRVPQFFYHKETGEKEKLVKRLETTRIRDPGNPMLLKVFTFLPSQVRAIRILLESQNPPLGDHIFEADIEFIYRFMIDKKIRFALERTPSGFLPIEEEIPSNLKYVFLDFEVYTNRKPDPRKLRIGEKVICATLWDNYSKIYHLFYEYSRQLTLPSFGSNVVVHYCVNERELLKSVTKYLMEQDPDIIAGYNIDWDLTCLIKTMEQRYKMSPDVISPLKKVKIRNSKKRLGDILINAPRARIWGRSTLDLLELYMKMHLSGLEEMTLEYVAKLEKLPIQKIVVPDFFDTWNKNPELIIRRNLGDVQIYVELEKKLNLIRFADEQRRLVGCRLEDTLSSKKMLDLFMMRMKDKKIMPTARSRGAKYIGAYVRDPISGMYSWVIQLDFSALYPTIMICFNIDPDTFRNPQFYKGSEDLFRLDESHAFVKDPIGLIPKMLKKLLELRAQKKQLQVEALAKNDDEAYKMYNLQEGVIKVLSNALYGVMGYRFRKGSKETVESVTLMGRSLITFVAEKLIESNRKVIYGDTDSVFFEAKGKSLDECLVEAKEIQAMIHAKLPEFLAKFGVTGEQPFNIEPAQIYSAFFILEAKKRYAGKIEWDSKRGTKLNYRYNIKGLETRRSDLSVLGKRIQKEVIHKLLEKTSKEEMLKFLETELSNFDTLPLTEIGTPSAIGQPLKAYKGNAIQKTSAEYSNNFLHTQFDVGSKPKRIAIKGVPPRIEQSEILVGLPKGQIYRVKNVPLSEITKLEMGYLDIKNKLKSYHADGSFVLDLEAKNQTISISYLQGYSDTHSIAIDYGIVPPPGFQIDYLKMLDSTVKKKIEKLIAMIGITWEEINLKPELKIVPKVPKKRKEKVDKKGKIKDDKQKTLSQFKC